MLRETSGALFPAEAVIWVELAGYHHHKNLSNVPGAILTHSGEDQVILSKLLNPFVLRVLNTMYVMFWTIKFIDFQNINFDRYLWRLYNIEFII